MTELWKTQYPTLATVNEASNMTLTEWDEHLPAPQTDVELTIRRRIRQKLLHAAGIADQWNSLMEQLERVTGIKTERF